MLAPLARGWSGATAECQVPGRVRLDESEPGRMVVRPLRAAPSSHIGLPAPRRRRTGPAGREGAGGGSGKLVAAPSMVGWVVPPGPTRTPCILPVTA